MKIGTFCRSTIEGNRAPFAGEREWIGLGVCSLIDFNGHEELEYLSECVLLVRISRSKSSYDINTRFCYDSGYLSPGSLCKRVCWLRGRKTLSIASTSSSFKNLQVSHEKKKKRFWLEYHLTQSMKSLSCSSQPSAPFCLLSLVTVEEIWARSGHNRYIYGTP